MIDNERVIAHAKAQLDCLLKLADKYGHDIVWRVHANDVSDEDGKRRLDGTAIFFLKVSPKAHVSERGSPSETSIV